MFYSGDPDISRTARAGYSTHLEGMIAGFEGMGYQVVPVIMGDWLAVPPGVEAVSASPSRSPGRRRMIGVARRLVPDPAWRVIRDARQLAADRRGRTVLRDAIEQDRIDFVYERSAPFHGAARAFARRRSVPFVIEINSPPQERQTFSRSSILDPLAARRLRSSILDADLAVFVSGALIDHYESFLGLPLPHAIVAPNAVAPATSAVSADGDRLVTEAEQMVSSLGAGPIVAFVGSMIEWHRVDLVLEAMVQVAAEHPDARLLVIGDGERREEYRVMAHRLGLGSVTTFTGAIDHELLLQVLQRVDIGVMAASNWWGSPVKLFEYAQAECAIVAPNVAPVREVFTDGLDAMLVEPTVADLVACIGALVGDAGLRRRLAGAAHRVVMNEHTWDQMARRVVSRLADRQTSPAQVRRLPRSRSEDRS